MTGHGYSWQDLKQVAASDLKVGDTWVTPGTGAAFYVSRDGSVRGHGWQDLDGTAWTLTSRDGDTITARSHDGREATGSIPVRARLLLVQ